MGKINNTKIIYTCGGLIIGLGILFALLLGNKSSSFLSSNKDGIQVVKTASGRQFVSSTAPKTTWKQIGTSNTKNHPLVKSQAHDSGYKPGSSYADDYVRAQEANHPLIASAKFLKKKDKLKNKRKGAKLSKGKPRFGVSEDDEDPGLSKSPDSPSSIMSASVANGPGKPKKTAEDEEENINTVEFWIEPIFEQENPEAVSKLVDSYKIKKVSNGVFYNVVTQMNEDSRVNIREMGLVALSSTPGPQSFSQLTWIKHNDIEAGLRTEAGRQVASYTDIHKLGYVVSTLKTSEESPYITVEALRTLTASTKKYGDLHALSVGNPKAEPVNMAILEPRYSRALELIEQNNLSNSSDAKVKTEATKAVAAITKFNTTL